MASTKQFHSVLRDKIDQAKHEMYTALPAKITAYDPKSQTCTAQPLFKTGVFPMPTISGVPVIFPSGGGAVMTFPVKVGDRCWLSFSMYPIDEIVVADGEAVDTNMTRTHDLNECVAFVGFSTMKKNYQPDPTQVMIRYGGTKMTFDDQGNVNITGKLIVSDTITGKDFVSSETGISFNEHKHHYFWTDGSGDADSEKPT